MLEGMSNEPVAKRPRRSQQERRRVVEETLKAGASVTDIARAHGVKANQVFRWRKLYREGRLDGTPAQRCRYASRKWSGSSRALASFGSNSDAPAFTSKEPSILTVSAWSWSTSLDDLAALGHNHLDRGRCH